MATSLFSISVKEENKFSFIAKTLAVNFHLPGTEGPCTLFVNDKMNDTANIPFTQYIWFFFAELVYG